MGKLLTTLVATAAVAVIGSATWLGAEHILKIRNDASEMSNMVIELVDEMEEMVDSHNTITNSLTSNIVELEAELDTANAAVSQLQEDVSGYYQNAQEAYEGRKTIDDMTGELTEDIPGELPDENENENPNPTGNENDENYPPGGNTDMNDVVR